MMKLAPMNAYPLPEGSRVKPSTLRTGHLYDASTNLANLKVRPEKVESFIESITGDFTGNADVQKFLHAYLGFAKCPDLGTLFHARFTPSTSNTGWTSPAKLDLAFGQVDKKNPRYILRAVGACTISSGGFETIISRAKQHVPQVFWQTLGIDT